MMHKIWMCGVLSGAILMSAGGGWAQQVSPPPPDGPNVMFVAHGDGPGGPGMEGAMGFGMELMGFGGMHGGKVVMGAPFSATTVTEMTQTLADGNHIVRKTQGSVYRDGQGRTRKELTLSAIGPLAAMGHAGSFVMIHDPAGKVAFMLHPENKTAEKIEMPAPGEKRGMHGDMGYRQQQELTDGSLKKEDLGKQTIGGVSAEGTRYTRTIAAGQIGNEKAITIVSERWYSPDLQMEVMSKRSDPMFGESSYTLTNIQRQEPAASLFTVPADYTVKTVKMDKHIHGMHVFGSHGGHGEQDGPPPPPPGN